MQFTGVQRVEEGQKGISAFLTGLDAGAVAKEAADTPLEEQDAGLGPKVELVEALDEESWTCPRCRVRLRPDPGDTDGRQLDRQRQEHEDFHAAMDLQASLEVKPPRPDPPVRKGKRRRTGGDIRSYLRPK